MARVYEYDVFISYRREGVQLPAWLRTHFYPLLVESLDNSTDREVKIFFDERVPGGTSWPMVLRSALSRARILVAICSPKYFTDEWCLAEWETMAQRERISGMVSPEVPLGLIYPVIFCDSETFPEFAHQRRLQDFRPWNVSFRQYDTTIEYIRFSREVERVSVELLQHIENAPEWRADWPVETPKPDPPGASRLPRF
nr:hypothetical protein GCM10017745_66960 [Saccharothrix mutabilis subsp. capreolus]